MYLPQICYFPRFHTVIRDPISLHFYGNTSSGLVPTDSLLATFQGNPQEALRAEAKSRSYLLGAAFAMHLSTGILGTYELMLYRAAGYKRIDIT